MPSSTVTDPLSRSEKPALPEGESYSTQPLSSPPLPLSTNPCQKMCYMISIYFQGTTETSGHLTELLYHVTDDCFHNYIFLKIRIRSTNLGGYKMI